MQKQNKDLIRISGLTIFEQNLFLFLCRKAKYFQPKPLTVKEKQQHMREYGDAFDQNFWYFVETCVPCFSVSVQKLSESQFEMGPFTLTTKNFTLEKLLGSRILEIQGLIKHGLITIAGGRWSSGIVKDYKTNRLYFHFYLGSKYPNDDRKIYPWIV